MPLTLGLPGFVIYALERKHLAPKNATLLMMLQLSLISMQLTLAVPLSMAAFP
jgi:hypothetical protein